MPNYDAPQIIIRVALSLFDPFFAFHPDLLTHRAEVESAFLGLARTIKQSGKIFIAGEGARGVVSRLMDAPFHPIAAMWLLPEVSFKRQIEALGSRYADGIWILNGANSQIEALQTARATYFNNIAFCAAPCDELRPFCDALVECEDPRLVDAICAVLLEYFSEENAFESVHFFVFNDEFDDYDPSADEEEKKQHPIDLLAEAVAVWADDWKDARNVEDGGLSRAQIEAKLEGQKEAFLNRDWSQITGVDDWGNHHHSFLVRGEVGEVGAALVSLCDASHWHPNVMGEDVTLGKQGYFLYRIEGQDWTIALSYRTSHRDDLVDIRPDLLEQLSKELKTATFSLSYSDNPSFLAYSLRQNGQILEEMQTRIEVDEGELPVVFDSQLRPELVGQEFDVYERAETLMREWKIYAPTREAAVFTPFSDIFDLQEGIQFELMNPDLTVYFNAELITISFPIERFDHIILVA